MCYDYKSVATAKPFRETMKITVSRTKDETWALRLTSGMFEDVLIATAEGLCLREVVFQGRTMVGVIKALWGTTVLCGDIYDHAPTIRALGLRGVFYQTLGEPLDLDYDGYIRSSRTPASTAQRVVVIGNTIYGEGVKSAIHVIG